MTHFEGLCNFRGLGGLPAADGHTTRHGALFRSEALDHATTVDLETIRGLGIGLVVDLRHPVETARLGARTDFPPGLEIRSATVHTARGMPADDGRGTILARLYLNYLSESAQNIVESVAAVAESPGGVLVHCAQGKDRTGIVIALLLTLVGVDRDTVLADYARTQDRMDTLLDRQLRDPHYGPRVAHLPAEVHRAEARTLAGFLDEVDSRYGGLARWARQAGLADDVVDRLRRRLLSH